MRTTCQPSRLRRLEQSPAHFSESTYYNKWIEKWDEDDGTELTESGFKGEFDFGRAQLETKTLVEIDIFPKGVGEW